MGETEAEGRAMAKAGRCAARCPLSAAPPAAFRGARCLRQVVKRSDADEGERARPGRFEDAKILLEMGRV